MIRFPRVLGVRAGYDPAQVDALIRRIEATLGRGVLDGPPLTADDIRAARFSTKLGGYNEVAVDYALDAFVVAVEIHAGLVHDAGPATAPSAAPASGGSAALPSRTPAGHTATSPPGSANTLGRTGFPGHPSAPGSADPLGSMGSSGPVGGPLGRRAVTGPMSEAPGRRAAAGTSGGISSTPPTGMSAVPPRDASFPLSRDIPDLPRRDVPSPSTRDAGSADHLLPGRPDLPSGTRRSLFEPAHPAVPLSAPSPVPSVPAAGPVRPAERRNDEEEDDAPTLPGIPKVTDQPPTGAHHAPQALGTPIASASPSAAGVTGAPPETRPVPGAGPLTVRGLHAGLGGVGTAASAAVWLEEQAVRVERVMFRPARLGSGYDEDEVDVFLDHVVATLRGTSEHPLTAEQVRKATFSTVVFKNGYAVTQVDAFLAELAGILDRREALLGEQEQHV
ncbi:hypothetical protein Sme01_70340 [Sphaerisporangium melleum]|uniref:DivIVA domain-containing protein n=1 Tax=Sphaerisporangium melleum TaxID=321316 RepID=A0A917RMZ0_9ACTN|nr:DivIVA domain-containing protein [Sphaerisporangium melleum]GGL15434.1 hypothetical protein GCM10007964_66800 [Sphaerisporangium melleum]GII74558.1 hypothetical protein Sme01_70340 [Sphaerisporangium melleum]